jgi:hypothetical protein
MPQAHQFVKGLSAGWIIAQAAQIGESTVNAVTEIMRRFEHPQQGFNGAMGILHLAKAYPPQKLEAACKRCLHFKMVSCRSVRSVLKQNLESAPLPGETTTSENPRDVLMHENLRRDFNCDEHEERPQQ